MPASRVAALPEPLGWPRLCVAGAGPGRGRSPRPDCALRVGIHPALWGTCPEGLGWGGRPGLGNCSRSEGGY